MHSYVKGLQAANWLTGRLNRLSDAKQAGLSMSDISHRTFLSLASGNAVVAIAYCNFHAILRQDIMLSAHHMPILQTPVQRLAVHLQDQETVHFEDDANLVEVLGKR